MDEKFHLSLSKDIPIIAELRFQDQMGFPISPQPLVPMSHVFSFPSTFMVWFLLITLSLSCESLGPSYLIFFSVCCCTSLTTANTTVSISFWLLSWEEFKVHFLLTLRPRPLAIISPVCSLNMLFQLSTNSLHPGRVCSHLNIKLKVKAFSPCMN